MNAGRVGVGREFLPLAVLLVALCAALPVDATAPSYTKNYVWDADRRLTMEIEADPGTGIRVATKYSYDLDGELVETDKGYTTQADGSDFVAEEAVRNAYDAVGNKIETSVLNGTAPASSTPALALTQYSYDADDRPLCTAVRMEQASFPSLMATIVAGQTAASVLPAGVTGCGISNGSDLGNPDRITQLSYDAAGQKLVETRALGVTTQNGYPAKLEEPYATYTYVDPTNGSQRMTLQTITDARGNRTTLTYDGFLRLGYTYYPMPNTPGASNTGAAGDYDGVALYDANDNATKHRKRDGSIVVLALDALNRVTSKTYQTASGTTAALPVYYSYDLLNHQLSALYNSASGTGMVYAYDNAGRMIGETDTGLTAPSGQSYTTLGLTYQYDPAGNRQRVTWPDGFYAYYDYDAMNRVVDVRENGATTGVGVLASYLYNDPLNLGRLTAINRGNGTSTSLGYDNADRLLSLAHAMVATGGNQAYGFTYNAASQDLARTATNPSYAWTNHPAVSVSKTYDGLNRDAAIVTASGYDNRGNLIFDGTRSFTYDVENRLLSETTGSPAVPVMTLTYDPQGRLRTEVATVSYQFLHDGDQIAAEYDASGNLLRRYVHAPGVDQPLVWYEGAIGSTDRRWLHADRQGSIVAQSNSSGAVTAYYAYGPYGEPQGWGGSRFMYTGQAQVQEAQLYYYKARFYDPITGRFLQTDPIGYKDNLDLYEYVADDPVDHSDPTGLTCTGSGENTKCQIDWVVDKDGKYRNATAADHKKYASFEKAYTDAVKSMLVHQGGPATITFKDESGKKITFNISAGSLGGGLKQRIMVADPSNKFQARNRQGHVSSDAVTPETGTGSYTRTYVGRGALTADYARQRTETGHEGIHGSREEKQATGPFGPQDGNGDAHQKPYDNASDQLQR